EGGDEPLDLDRFDRFAVAPALTTAGQELTQRRDLLLGLTRLQFARGCLTLELASLVDRPAQRLRERVVHDIGRLAELLALTAAGDGIQRCVTTRLMAED